MTPATTPADARPGEHVVIELRATIPAGYHLYAMTRIRGGPKPLEINVNDGRLAPVGAWTAREPTVVFDARFGKAVERFDGEIVHRRVFSVAASATPGRQVVELDVKGQICDHKQCVAFRERVQAVLAIEAGAARPAHLAVPAIVGTPFPPDRPEPARAAAVGPVGSVAKGARGAGVPLGEGLWSFLLLALLAGLGALFTPCVFPMIPITVGVFSKYAKASVLQSAAMAGLYAVSIIFCFTIIGVVVSALFGAVGMQSLSASAGFNIFLFILLAGFSFNLFGLFEITLPSGLIVLTSTKERQLTGDTGSLVSQSLGVVLMALTFTLVSFTCTVGFVGVVLAQAANGHWFFPAIGMFAFSFAFSIPFFFLAFFPSWANRLRGKSGDWMVAIKVILGFFELAGSFKFLSNVDLLWHWGLITRPLVLTVWAASFFTAALYLLRVFALPSPAGDGKDKSVGPIRMAFALLMLALSIHSASGIRDTKSMGGWLDGWLPPAVYPGDEPLASGDELTWIKDDLESAVSEGRRVGRPVFVDFTGYTCTNCRYMEASMFPRANIRSRLERMVLAQAFTDCDAPVCEQQRAYQVNRFDTAALPFYAIINPYDDAVLASFASSTNDTAEYEAFLQEGLNAFESANASSAKTLPKSGVVLVERGPAVDFSFSFLAGGGPWKLSRLRGQWALVNFWASWCGPCVKELEHEFPAAMRKAPWVKLVTITFEDPDTKAAALTFAREHALLTESVALFGGPSVTEAKLDAAFEAVDSLPASYLIAPDGHIAWKHRGSVDATLLDQVLALTKAGAVGE